MTTGIERLVDHKTFLEAPHRGNPNGTGQSVWKMRLRVSYMSLRTEEPWGCEIKSPYPLLFSGEWFSDREPLLRYKLPSN